MLKRKEKKWLAEGVVTGKAQSVMELLEDLGTVPDEIKEKIELLNEEQDHIDSKRESRVSMIITVFGFVSIIAAALQILDYLSSGRGVMIGGFVGMVMGILGISFGIMLRAKK